MTTSTPSEKPAPGYPGGQDSKHKGVSQIIPARRSLKTRVTLFTLLIFLVSIWTLAFYVSRLVREDMQRTMGEQQFSTATFVAAAISQELEDRLKALETQAALITPEILSNTALTQAFLEHHPVFQNYFNAGNFITRTDGIPIADVPAPHKRIGLSVAERDYIIAALKEDRSSVGHPVIGKNLGTPIIGMAAPIRHPQGKVIGALVGVIDLSKPNILDKIAGNKYGKTGGYLLVDRKHRQIVTATDKKRVMSMLPPHGGNYLVDRFMGGYEGYGTVVNPVGEEVLAAAKSVSAADWYVVVSLPTAEAFATIRDAQQRTLLFTLLLTCVAGILTWWMLRRQLSPMLAAANALASMTTTVQDSHDLPVTDNDEIGDLIGGFNRLLQELRQSNQALQDSEYRWKFAIEGAGDGLWDWNVQDGTVFFSTRWKDMLGYGEHEIGNHVDEWKQRVHPADAPLTLATLQNCLDGEAPAYSSEHRVRCRNGEYMWILDRGIVVSRSDDGKPLRMIGTHSDIDHRKQTEFALRNSELAARVATENARSALDRLRQSESLLSSAQQAAMIGCYNCNIKDGTWEATPVLEQILGITAQYPHTIHGWTDLMHPDFMRSMHQALTDSIRSGKPFDAECKIIRPSDGAERWMHGLGKLVVDENGDSVRLVGTVQDITESKQAQLAILESEKFIREIAAQAPGCLYQFKLRPDGSFCAPYASVGLRDLYGIDPDEVREDATKIFSYVHPDDIDGFASSIQASARTLSPWNRQYRLMREDGSPRWLAGHALPRREEDGSVLWHGFITDVTEQMNLAEELNMHRTQLEALVAARTAELDAANQRLRKSDQRLSAMFAMGQTAHQLDEHEILQLGIEEATRLTDSEIGYIHFLNTDGETLTLGTWSQATLRHCSAAYDNHYPISTAGVWADAVRLRLPVMHNDYQALAERKGYPEGHAHLVRHLGVPVMEDGTVRLLIGVGNKATDYDDSDVTELNSIGNDLWSIIMRRRAELALAAAEARTHLIIESSAEGILQLDATGRIGLANRAACTMLGYEPAELLGRDAHAAIHCPHDNTATEQTPCHLAGAVRAGRTLRADKDTFWCADGRPLPVTLSIHPMREGETLIGAVLSFSDNTQRLAVEHAREAARAEAELLARSKSEFLANMSHEIRTPLNGVLGLAQIGHRDNIGHGKTQETFARILESGNLLMAIINDILDLSKIEAGKFAVESVPVDPGYSVDAAAASLAERAAQKNVRLLVEKAPDLPAAVVSDPTRIAQILLNLLSNAIKFTARGEIRLAALRDDRQLVFRVSDTGIGMTPEQMALLFSPFQQADSSTTRKYGGTGLGLTISRHLARLMGGDIQVSSAAGRGSTFELRLPCIETSEAVKTAASSLAEGPAEPRLKGLRILAAEDNEVNQLVLADMLTREEAELEMVGDGKLAVEAVTRNPAAFDVVLMDVQMPEMDGYQATRQIRALAPALPVIGQTAHALASEHEKCHAAGMVDTITKPLDLGALIGVILRHVRSAADVAVAPSLPATAPSTGLGIIDWAQLEHRYADRPAFIPKVLGVMLNAHSNVPAQMRDAAASGDMKQLAFLAHTSKGTGGSVFAHQMQTQAQATEVAARSASADALVHAEKLATIFEATLAEIREYLA